MHCFPVSWADLNVSSFFGGGRWRAGTDWRRSVRMYIATATFDEISLV
ncbi:hypothetical protein HMPREF9621_02796 [Cutibacterium modestum HL037PA2]|uniref:Uncharacterized protein n=1 Tax=Cutibacterium modestum HL044PA1 TaxID=765109 RepID=A0ABN0C6N3_9ACTN|nr:hypothetical protein HMPREF9621_02796 [Cutibacterium modestum HL037PA2]EFS92985.1 hypothetical protein HMPREF9607_00836 [Cutibacterium modestum HL044PA1]